MSRFFLTTVLAGGVLLAGLATMNSYADNPMPRTPSSYAMADPMAVEQRVALVIGNAAYRASPLSNPVNDASDMAKKLAKLGFEVTLKTDAGQQDMNRAITEFGDKLKPGGVALFYYAGHAIQADGSNYLIPVDADIKSASSVFSEAVDVDKLLKQLAPARVSMLLLDACRNNPFKRSRGSAGGLASIDAPMGTYIVIVHTPPPVLSFNYFVSVMNLVYVNRIIFAVPIYNATKNLRYCPSCHAVFKTTT